MKTVASILVAAGDERGGWMESSFIPCTIQICQPQNCVVDSSIIVRSWPGLSPGLLIINESKWLKRGGEL